MTVRLALDASMRAPSCAVALADDDIRLASAVNRPVEEFPRVIREALELGGISLQDVDELVACVGPGSYMGVRSAVATANALGLAIDRPVTGVLSLDAAAARLTPSASATVAVPAGRSRFFVSTYRWDGSRLCRDDAPGLVERTREGTWFATEPRAEGGAGTIPLDAQGVLVVAIGHRHLVTEACSTEVATVLPPPVIGG